MTRPVPAAQAHAALVQKGFRVANGNRDHHMYFLYDGGAKTRFFMKISRGGREVRVDEMKNTVRPFGIRTDDLFSILNCEYDAARTLSVWRNRPIR